MNLKKGILVCLVGDSQLNQQYLPSLLI